MKVLNARIVHVTTQMKRNPIKDLVRNSQYHPTTNTMERKHSMMTYDVAILPIADLIRGDDITIVPDGPLHLLLHPRTNFSRT